MHLAPCPHCGAVNDISSAECYRCHGVLEGAATPDGIANLEAAAAPGGDVIAADDSAETGNSRPSLVVVGIILIAFAAASYYAYRQRSLIGARETVTPVQADAPPGGGTVASPAKLTAPAAAATPVVAAPPAEAATVRDTPAADTSKPAALEPAAESRQRRQAAPVSPLPAAPSPQATDRRTIPLPAPAPIATCTEAVAALGLCKADAK